MKKTPNHIGQIQQTVQNGLLSPFLFKGFIEFQKERSERNERAAKARRGKFSGSIPPYGYICEDGVLKVRTDDTSNIIRRIFNDYLASRGMDTIAKTLTTERVPTPVQIANKSNASIA